MNEYHRNISIVLTKQLIFGKIFSISKSIIIILYFNQIKFAKSILCRICKQNPKDPHLNLR